MHGAPQSRQIPWLLPGSRARLTRRAGTRDSPTPPCSVLLEAHEWTDRIQQLRAEILQVSERGKLFESSLDIAKLC